MEHFTFNELNIWAILVASLMNMFIGFLWYSKTLFGRQWMALIGLKEEDANPKPSLFIYAYLLGLLIAFVMAVLLQSAGSALTGLVYGGVIAIGFVIPTILTHYLYEGRKGGLMLIVAGHELLVFLSYGALLGGWQ